MPHSRRSALPDDRAAPQGESQAKAPIDPPANLFIRLAESTTRFLKSLSKPESYGLCAGAIAGFAILFVVWLMLGEYRYETRFIMKFYLCTMPLAAASSLSLLAGLYGLLVNRRNW